MEKVHEIPELKFFGRIDKITEFFSKYEAIDKESSYVINYHGIGGVGKSWLCRELSKEHRRRFSDAKNFVLNLEELNNSGDKVEILSSLMMKFMEVCGFKFPHFMYALYVYYKSRGLSNDGPEMDRLQDNPLINSGLDLLAMVMPNLVTLGKAFETFNMERELEKIKCNPMISKLEGMSSEEISNELVLIFATELSEQTIKKDIPVIVFLDTYEKLQNYVKDTKSASISEEWLYAPNGLFRNVSNIMWVITGQEEIKESVYNLEWKDETYCLHKEMGAFVSNQIKIILESVAITEPSIVQKIVEETQGIPVAIDACVKIYYSKTKPEPRDFEGIREKLVDRLIGGLAYEDKDIIDILACMRTWKREDISRQFPVISNDRYKKIKRLSLIEDVADTYSLNKNVQHIVFKECDDAILNYCVNYYERYATDERLSVNEQKEYLKKKVKLQINIIGSKDDTENKSKLTQLYINDILSFIRQNIYNVVLFDEIERDILELKIYEGLKYPYDKIFHVYKAYQYIIGGEYSNARTIISEKGLLYEYTKLDSDTKALLYCILSDAVDEEHSYYEEISNQLLDKKNLHIEQSVLFNHANLLLRQGKYACARKYIRDDVQQIDDVNNMQDAVLKCMTLIDKMKILINDSEMFEAEACLEIAEKIIQKYEHTNEKDVLLMYSDICNCFVTIFGKKNYVAKDIELLEKIENKSMKYKLQLIVDYKLKVNKESSIEEFIYCLQNARILLKENYLEKRVFIEKQLHEWVEETKIQYQKCNVLDYKWELIELGYWVASCIRGDLYDVVLNRIIFSEYKVSMLIQKFQKVNSSDDFLENAIELIKEIKEDLESLRKHSGGVFEPEVYWQHYENIAQLEEQIFTEKMRLAEAEQDEARVEYYREKVEQARAEYEKWHYIDYPEDDIGPDEYDLPDYNIFDDFDEEEMKKSEYYVEQTSGEGKLPFN